MSVTRCAVIGVGHVGRFHAAKYAALPNAELVAVADTDEQCAERVATMCGGGCAAVADYRTLLGEIEAVSVAVPTSRHYEVVRAFLGCGTHVLVEKPIAATLEQAQALNRLAHRHGMVFQVGHLERFNPAVAALRHQEIRPLFIESHRLAPFSSRVTDVDVVLDLMIHDLDIILQFVKSPVCSLAACGARVLTDDVDIANARIAFESGCVANVTASRVSLKTERKMRVFLDDAYVAVDFQAQGMVVHRVANRNGPVGARQITSEQRFFGERDAIMAEIVAFLEAIQTGAEIAVSGDEGLQALAMAIRIAELVQRGALVLGGGGENTSGL